MRQPSPETISEALSFVPAHDRDLWVRMASAVASELGDGGFELWDSWSQSADNYNAKAHSGCVPDALRCRVSLGSRY